MPSRAFVAAGVLIAVAGSAVTAVAVTRRTSGMPAELETRLSAVAAQIDHDATTMRTAVLDRAGALGTLEAVQVIVTGDPATASDTFARGDLEFTVQPGEVIELGSVVRHGQDEPKFSERTVLLVEPSSAQASRADAHVLGASQADLAGCTGVVPRACAAVVYSTAYQVAPSYDAENLVGYVLVSRRLDLERANARFAGDAHCGEEGTAPAGWVALATAPASGFACFARIPDPESMTLPIGLGVGVILAGLAVAIAGVAGRRRETWA